MREMLLVGAGSFFGGITRYLVSGWALHTWTSSKFPIGTFLVNSLGCFVIGLIGGVTEQRHVISPELRLLVITGFLGGFTTFSAFGYETVILVRNGEIVCAALNVGLSLVVCLAAVWMGLRVTI
jgi:fluoride exporter